MDWLERTPSAVFSAFSRMIPRIEAHESRLGANVVAVGHGIKPGRWIRKQLSEWQREAEGGTSSVRKAPGARDLAAAGIKLKVVKRG